MSYSFKVHMKMWFHLSTWKVQPSLCEFSCISDEQCYVKISYTEFHSLDNKHRNYIHKFIDAPKYCFHCTNFLNFPQWQHAQIFCTEFTQSGQEKRKECVKINLFPELKYNDHSWLSQTHACSWHFLKNFYTKFHENLTHGCWYCIRDKCRGSQHIAFFFCI